MLRAAAGVGVALVARVAVAVRPVPDHLAVSVEATGAGARVRTHLVDTGPAQGTVRVDGTFGSTACVWVAKVARGTGAGDAVVESGALCVLPAWRPSACIYVRRKLYFRWNFN